MRFKFVMCLLLATIPQQTIHGEKFVIGSWSAGFFSDFFVTLNNLMYADRTNKAPVVYWDHHSFFYDPGSYNGLKNAWEYYFEPVSSQSWSEQDNIYRNSIAPDGTNLSFLNPVYSNIQNRQYINAYIQKYIKIKPTLQKKIDAFSTFYFKNTKVIGMHLRGTDKWHEIKPVDPLTILEKANSIAKQLAKNNESYEFFVATDEQNLLKLAIQKLNKRPLYYPSKRSSNNQPLYFGTSKINHTGILGEEILIEVILLSRCNYFLHTNSNVSLAVCCFNPSIKNYSFDCNGDSSYCKEPKEFIYP